MLARWSTLLRSLYDARSFEEAANLTLGALMAQVDGLIPDRTIRILRAMVHLRPEDTYRGIHVREATPATGLSTLQLTPSLTAWRWVQAAGGAVLFDVHAGQASAAGGAAIAGATELAAAEFRSRETVLGRRTTHIIAIPLHRPGGGLDGFLSIELNAAPPWSDIAQPLELLAALATPFLVELPCAPDAELAGEEGLPVVGTRMRQCVSCLRLFAKTDETILLQGETGVGKTRLAEWCWKNSPRSGGRFVQVNLEAQPESLREGALFGWVKGAFTQAVDNKRGLVETAAGGTLFIDEIDKLSLSGQAMLLSLLDEGRFRVIGDNDLKEADVRFIIGTNINLYRAVEEGRFLRDLYFRIRVMPVRIPPLRERGDEIIGWAAHFITALQTKVNPRITARLEPRAGALLESCDWPGNLRQLHNVVKRARAFAAEEARRDARDEVVVRSV
ncbi:MAG: sigma 54-interacting transcriptional regulator, partial [Nitrospira sp.]|nr:sigma 54-interacting transcriptional regulator [Nitrospira sp.]